MARWLEKAGPVPPNVAPIDDADHEALLQDLRTPVLALPAMRPVKAKGPMRLVSRRALVRRLALVWW